MNIIIVVYTAVSSNNERISSICSTSKKKNENENVED